MLRSAHNSDKWRFNAPLLHKALIIITNIFSERRLALIFLIFSQLYSYCEKGMITCQVLQGGRPHRDSAIIFGKWKIKKIDISFFCFAITAIRAVYDSVQLSAQANSVWLLCLCCCSEHWPRVIIQSCIYFGWKLYRNSNGHLSWIGSRFFRIVVYRHSVILVCSILGADASHDYDCCRYKDGKNQHKEDVSHVIRSPHNCRVIITQIRKQAHRLCEYTEYYREARCSAHIMGSLNQDGQK